MLIHSICLTDLLKCFLLLRYSCRKAEIKKCNVLLKIKGNKTQNPNSVFQTYQFFLALFIWHNVCANVITDYLYGYFYHHCMCITWNSPRVRELWTPYYAERAFQTLITDDHHLFKAQYGLSYFLFFVFGVISASSTFTLLLSVITLNITFDNLSSSPGRVSPSSNFLSCFIWTHL